MIKEQYGTFKKPPKALTRIAVLISGSGSTAAAVIKACLDQELPAEVVLILSSRRQAGGIDKAKSLGLAEQDIVVVEKKSFAAETSFGKAIIKECQQRKVEVIAQCGWLAKTPPNVIKVYEGKIFNQHPGPLDPPGRPDFGGKGMYGENVHKAVVYFAQRCGRRFFTEATTHLVTEEYDRGWVIGRTELEVLPDDTPLSLQQRLLPLEHQLVIQTLKKFCAKSVETLERPECLIKENEIRLLQEAKQYGINGVSG